ncbi:uncharacterized protein EAF01_004967 [Botrytis porri]|uniref:Uncharacterized protein n=1 Tax=Botrytis porri TaxID=87229 RepID=A0A4Z1L1Y0_9HELO|nr:uncharacterized protein EAF01_004967 [Botrytis porri]KAF7907380.1 hypothetical protein EAF01_004967 [Botrytis porri]TGO90790.1 hypothetical protein BPOR_0051g00250 [Botrytis porri]
MSGGFILQAVYRTLQARRVEIQLAKLAQEENAAWEIAAISVHPWLKYNGSSKTLEIVLDFSGLNSPFQQNKLTKNLIQILPKYSSHATNIHIDVVFGIPHMDVINNNTKAARHWAMANVVYELNKFRQLDSVRVSLSVQRIYWEQLKPVSAIYGLDYTRWTFDIVENGTEKAIEIDSDFDCKLSSHFNDEMYW